MDRRLVAGCMTGTSIDAIDTALIEVRGRGLAMTASVLASSSLTLDDLAAPLRAIAEGQPHTAEQVARIAHDFGIRIADAIERLEAQSFDLCAVHGQTVHHSPPLSWQLLNPWVIAERLACDVVYDLRGADLAAGGEGAPITPLADRILFGSENEDRVIVNLGGFCNATYLPAGGSDGVRGADVCACNQVLDAVARTTLGQPYDEGGACALAGTPDPAAAESLRRILERQSQLGDSLGSGDEAAEWVTEWAPRLAPSDLAAAAAAGVGATVRAWIDTHAGGARVLLAGGGVLNGALVRAIGECETTEALGVPPAAREAAAMAVLGALAQDRVRFTLPEVTGRRPSVVVDGAWVIVGARV